MIQRVIKSLAASLTVGNSKGLALVKRCVHGMSRVHDPGAYCLRKGCAVCAMLPTNGQVDSTWVVDIYTPAAFSIRN